MANENAMEQVVTAQPFEVLILLHPTKKSSSSGDKTKIILDKTMFLAKDANTAMILASRMIPEEHIENIERVQVLVRPF